MVILVVYELTPVVLNGMALSDGLGGGHTDRMWDWRGAQPRRSRGGKGVSRFVSSWHDGWPQKMTRSPDIFACALKKHIAQRTCVHRCSCLVELPNQVELDVSLSSKYGWSYREEWLPQAVLTHTGAPRPIALSQKRLGFRSIVLDQLIVTEHECMHAVFVSSLGLRFQSIALNRIILSVCMMSLFLSWESSLFVARHNETYQINEKTY